MTKNIGLTIEERMEIDKLKEQGLLSEDGERAELRGGLINLYVGKITVPTRLLLKMRAGQRKVWAFKRA